MDENQQKGANNKEEDTMISKIFSLIFKLITFLLSLIISLVFNAFPNFNFSNFTEIYQAFWGLLGKAGNLLYFMSGNMIFIYIDIVFALFALKHVVLPVINLIRKDILRG